MKTILLVEDDTALRECYVMSLFARGYNVTVARDGAEAWGIYGPGKFDFVLTDYQMPGKNGYRLLLDIWYMNPAQRMALMSADPPVLRAELSGVPVLEKPFKMEELLKILEGE